MSAGWLLPTAIMLGIYVLMAGLYGLAYTMGRLHHSRAVQWSGYGFYGVQGVMTVLLLALTPLAVGWKVFLVASFAVYAVIPPATWRHLERTHDLLEHEP